MQEWIDAVDRMVAHHAPFDEIEEFIEGLPLPEDHRSALWLLAWSEDASPAVRRKVVLEPFGC